MDKITKQQMVKALEALSDELRVQSAKCEFILVGGAALILLFDARSSTKDLDVLLVSGVRSVVERAIRTVSSRLNLPGDWINDAAKGFIHGVSPGRIVFASDALLVRTLAVEQMLAMKLAAWRDDVDIDDARLLVSKLSGSVDEVWHKVEPYVIPGLELKARYALGDVWESVHGHS